MFYFNIKLLNILKMILEPVMHFSINVNIGIKQQRIVSFYKHQNLN